MWTHTHAHTYLHIYTDTTPAHVCIFTPVCTCTLVHIHKHTCTCLCNSHMDVHIHLCMYTPTHIHTCTDTHARTLVYTHMYSCPCAHPCVHTSPKHRACIPLELLPPCGRAATVCSAGRALPQPCDEGQCGYRNVPCARQGGGGRPHAKVEVTVTLPRDTTCLTADGTSRRSLWHPHRTPAGPEPTVSAEWGFYDQDRTRIAVTLSIPFTEFPQ